MTETERDRFYYNSHCHSRRWRIKFDKYLQSGNIIDQSDEVFGLYESAVEFANSLQTKDGCNSYFNDDSSFAVNIRMYEEIGQIVREVPKECWSNLADQLTTTSLRWQVRFTKCDSGHCSTSECESFETYEAACRFANNLSKKDFRNTYFAMSGLAAADIHIVETGKYERNIPWESWSELSKSIDEINKELDTPYVVPEEYKKPGMTFEVHHVRVPKPQTIHSANPITLMIDKFNNFDTARSYALHLVNGDGPAYVIESCKANWMFNVNIYAVEHDIRTLVPIDKWNVNSEPDHELSGMIEYCAEVAGITGERNMLQEELTKTRNELKALKDSVRKILNDAADLDKVYKPLE